MATQASKPNIYEALTLKVVVERLGTDRTISAMNQVRTWVENGGRDRTDLFKALEAHGFASDPADKEDLQIAYEAFKDILDPSIDKLRELRQSLIKKEMEI